MRLINPHSGAICSSLHSPASYGRDVFLPAVDCQQVSEQGFEVLHGEPYLARSQQCGLQGDEDCTNS